MHHHHTRLFMIVLFFLVGAAALCLCSTLQKLVIGAPLVLIGYVVPFFFGGFAGAGMGLWYTRFQKTNEELARARDELEDAVAARTDDLQSALAKKQESEQALWAIVDTMHSGIVLIDAAGKISFGIMLRPLSRNIRMRNSATASVKNAPRNIIRNWIFMRRRKKKFEISNFHFCLCQFPISNFQ